MQINPKIVIDAIDNVLATEDLDIIRLEVSMLKGYMLAFQPSEQPNDPCPPPISPTGTEPFILIDRAPTMIDITIDDDPSEFEWVEGDEFNIFTDDTFSELTAIAVITGVDHNGFPILSFEGVEKTEQESTVKSRKKERRARKKK